MQNRHNAHNSQRPKIHGHRGARGLYPENTLKSVSSAVKLGSDAVEIDVWVSQDDRLIVHHDPRLSPAIARDASGAWVEKEWPIRDLKAAELSRYDVGRMNPKSDYASQFPEQTSCDGQHIPSLEDIVGQLREINADIEINIELKSAPGEPSLMPPFEQYIEIAAREISSLGIIDRALVQSFDWRLPLGIKCMLPGLKIGLLSDQRGQYGLSEDGKSPCHDSKSTATSIRLKDLPGIVGDLGANIWSPNFTDIETESLSKAHQLGLEVCVWTVNHVQHMRDMIDLGVDIITTDYPDRLTALRPKRTNPR